uniref:C-type lectin domain-containing protein n=1 Tax=Xiphophorus maculatus TaxID=8083 RepID=A0A3B5PUA7_XIPMA
MARFIISWLDYIWNLCNRTTLQCSRCLPGWREHASRCFLLSNVEKTWENAPVVLDAADQAFLTNMTFQFKMENPNSTFHSAWIRLEDMVKGRKLLLGQWRLKYDVIYWRPGEPNNTKAAWDTDESGQDCVSILPPDEVGIEGWMNSWDDIICFGKRNYLCETDALILA